MRTVVVAGVIQKLRQVLIAKRSSGTLAGLWEFPGGKVHDGESPQEALTREIYEEFGASINVHAHICDVPFSVDGNQYLLTAYYAEYLTNKFELHEHADIQWVLPNQLKKFKFAPADRQIVEIIQSMGEQK